MKLSTELNEKRLVLSGISMLNSMEAFNITAQYLDNPELKPEAEVAIVRLVRNVENGDKDKIKETLIKIKNTTENTLLRDRIENMLERP